MTDLQAKHIPSRNTEARRAYFIGYQAKPDNRLKLRAREMVAYAIKKGTLVSLPCETCGDARTQAHHEDYSKPFEVIWLCSKCHGAMHRKSHCIRGHALTDYNIRIYRGYSRCRMCGRIHRREQTMRKQLSNQIGASQ